MLPCFDLVRRMLRKSVLETGVEDVHSSHRHDIWPTPESIRLLILSYSRRENFDVGWLL